MTHTHNCRCAIFTYSRFADTHSTCYIPNMFTWFRLPAYKRHVVGNLLAVCFSASINFCLQAQECAALIFGFFIKVPFKAGVDSSIPLFLVFVGSFSEVQRIFAPVPPISLTVVAHSSAANRLVGVTMRHDYDISFFSSIHRNIVQLANDCPWPRNRAVVQP